LVNIRCSGKWFSLVGCLLAVMMVGADYRAALAQTDCLPLEETLCRPVNAVEVVADYLYNLKASTLDKIEAEALYALFTKEVHKELSQRKLKGLVEDMIEGGTFNLTSYAINPRVELTKDGEAVCRTTLHYFIYPSGMMTPRSMEVVIHARFEDGAWKLSRRPSYKGGFDFYGMFP